MKKITLFFFVLAISIVGKAVTVNVTTAGTMRSTLVSNSVDPLTVIDLTVTGSINASDFKDMRDNMPLLENVDISGAAIVAYTGTYHPAGTTSTTFAANVIPNSSFNRTTGLAVVLKTIKFPSTVTEVGEYAFGNTKLLNSVDFNGAPVTKLGRFAFYRCYALTTITLPSTLTEIGFHATATSAGYAFKECTGLTSIVWPASALKIYQETFAGCTALNSVTGIGNVNTIGKKAFQYASALTSLSIGAPTVTMDSLTFQNAYPNVTVHASNASFSATDGALFNKAQTKLIYCPTNKTTFTIPGTVVNIGGYAFGGSKIESIVIPASVKAIYPYAFVMATKLASVDNTNATYTYIGDYAFQRDSALTSFTIPATLTVIKTKAFESSGLTSITIPATLPSFGGNYVFGSCANLQTVVFESSATSMTNLTGTYTFYDCYSLKNITLPSTLLVLPDFTFTFHNENTGGVYNSALQTVSLPTGLTTIGQYAFAGSKVLQTVNLPSTLTTIGEGAFYNCPLLSSNVVIPSGVTALNANIFTDCLKLTSVTIPNTVTSLGNSLFMGCKSLNVNVPTSVQKIYASCFEGVRGVTAFAIPVSCDSIGEKAFSDTKANITVDVSNAKYSSASNIVYDKNMKRIVGSTGKVNGGFTIPSTVENVWNSAFYKDSTLTEVQIPSTVKRLSAYAFGYCVNLTKVYAGAETPLARTTSATAVGVHSNAFGGNTVANITLYVPTAPSISLYQADALWVTFGSIVSGLTTSIENNQLDTNNSKISVYPNPVTTGFVISNTGLTNMNVSIYNMNGSLVMQTSSNDGQYIDMKNIANGVYVVKINADTKILEQKFVKL